MLFAFVFSIVANSSGDACRNSAAGLEQLGLLRHHSAQEEVLANAARRRVTPLLGGPALHLKVPPHAVHFYLLPRVRTPWAAAHRKFIARRRSAGG